MRIKPTRKHGVVVELGPNEAQLATNDLPFRFKLKRVLVPVDFSDCSKKALQYAVPFAQQFGAALVLLHAVQPYMPVPEMKMVGTDVLLNRAREGGEAELQKLRAVVATSGVPVETVLRIGRPDFEIVNAADDLNADVIILSTHGRTGLSRVFFGSVAEHVTRYARCPVLIVREREHEFVETSSATNAAQPVGKSATPRAAVIAS